MFKIIYIPLIVVIFSWSCSVSKRTLKEETGLPEISKNNILEVTEKQNITESSFFIERGKILASGDSGKIRLLFTIKFNRPGNFLISLKSTTGIEAYRIFITKDTVLINDRIKQVTLFGKPYDFERMAGLPSALIKISFGDIFIDRNNVKTEGDCVGNSLKVSDYYQGLIIRTIIDCTLGKARSVRLSSGPSDDLINISYSKYNQENYRIPGKVEINDLKRRTKITLKIEKYTVPWSGQIEFIPGRGYKLKRLL